MRELKFFRGRTATPATVHADDNLVVLEAEVKWVVRGPQAQLDRLAADGKFPKPVKIGARAAGFVAAEVDAWIAERIRKRDEGEQSAPQPARRGGRFAKNAAA